MPAESIAWMVTRARAGDAAAQRGLVERFAPTLRLHIARITGDADGAQDLAQDAFAAAFQKLHTLREPEAARAWLLRIATNLALQTLRRNRAAPVISLDDAGDIAQEESDPAGRVAQQDAVRAALATLPERDALCLTLHYMLDLRQTEIAAMLGMTPDAVRKRIARGAERFRARYHALFPEEVRSHG